MAIYFNEQEKTFHLEGKDYSYIMGVAYDRFLSHLYYGKKVNMLHPSRKMVSRELGFSPSPLEFFYNRSVSLDTLPQEFPSFGYTDFRIPAIIVEQENGSRISDFRYSSYQITNSKPKISNMPSIHDDGKVTTLIIDLVDEVINVVAHLIYNVYEERNVLTRHVIIENKGKEKIKLTKVMSMSFDMHDANFNFMQLHGTHCKERHIEVSPLRHGITKIESRRGSSSHMMNPFFALMRKNCDENQGEIFGFNFVYSGNYEGCVEVDQRETARIQMGISGFDFEWELKPNEKFETPEVVMVYSDQGINDMSNTFHDLYNQCLLKKQYHHPIVVNNWEATYFDFNEEKLTKLIQSAKGLGIETFVLDDGWFGKRNNDESSLGDWKVNLTKLPGGLEKISQIANENGLKFGLWFEPEAISIDSDLYRAHPDYAIKIANRDHAVSRCELLLDLSRKEVCDYVINAMSDIIDTVKLSYIKWDFNRNVTETYSKDLAHKYVLGLYYILETLTTKYPNLLIEGCSGGGGRVDPGMLYYTPQIWTSDDSDAIERLFIQYGTSICYPPTTMVGHVSVTPNHQTGRITPFNTRGIVAMSANFGYELNPQVLTEKEREMVKEQTSTYANLRKVIYDSDFYRLRSPFKGNDCAWSFVSKDKKKFYVMYVRILNGATNEFDWLKFKGLAANKKYQNLQTKEIFTGDELMKIGVLLPRHPYDFHGILYEFEEVE